MITHCRQHINSMNLGVAKKINGTGATTDMYENVYVVLRNVNNIGE